MAAPPHYMSTSAGRREELDLQLHLVREKRNAEQKLFDELAENLSLSKDEILKLVEEKMQHCFPSAVDVQGRVVNIGEEIRVKDDSGLLFAAECDLPVQDTLKKIYLGEKGILVQVVPSFHGRMAAVIRFADGAQKCFFLECLDLSGIKTTGKGCASAPQDARVSTGKDKEDPGRDVFARSEERFEDNDSPTWNDICALHKMSHNRSFYSRNASPSNTTSEADVQETELAASKPVVSAINKSVVPLPPPIAACGAAALPPPSLDELRRHVAPPQTIERLSHHPSGSRSTEKEKTMEKDTTAQSSTLRESVRSKTAVEAEATSSKSPRHCISIQIPGTPLHSTPLRPVRTNAPEDTSPAPHAPPSIYEDKNWSHRPLGLLGPSNAALQPAASPSPTSPVVEPATATEGLPISLQVVESSAPLPADVLQTLAKHKGTLGGQPDGPGSTGVPPRSHVICKAKSPRVGTSAASGIATVPHCAMGLAKRRPKLHVADGIFDGLGQPLAPEQLEEWDSQPVNQLLTVTNPAEKESDEEEPVQDPSRLTGILQVAPPGYKPKFSFYDANTSIPRYVPVQPSSMRRVLVAGYLRIGGPHNTTSSGATLNNPPDSARSASSVTAPRLRFVEVFYRRDATMDVILQITSNALGWEEERAERLFTLTGNEVLWEENIEDGMQLIATPGNLYHPIRQVSEHPSTARDRESTGKGTSFSSDKESESFQLERPFQLRYGGEKSAATRFNHPHPGKTAPALSGSAVRASNVSGPQSLSQLRHAAPPAGRVNVSRRTAAAHILNPSPLTPLNVTQQHEDPKVSSGEPSPRTGTPILPRAKKSPAPPPRHADAIQRGTGSAASTTAKLSESGIPSTSSSITAAQSKAAQPPSAAVKPAVVRRPVKAPAVTASKPIHIKVFENGQYDEDERVFRIVTVRSNYKTIGALKTLLARELEWRDGKKVDLLFDATGVPISSLQDIRDGEAVVASSGDRFIVPYPNSVLHREALKLDAPTEASF